MNWYKLSQQSFYDPKNGYLSVGHKQMPACQIYLWWIDNNENFYKKLADMYMTHFKLGAIRTLVKGRAEICKDYKRTSFFIHKGEQSDLEAYKSKVKQSFGNDIQIIVMNE